MSRSTALLTVGILFSLTCCSGSSGATSPAQSPPTGQDSNNQMTAREIFYRHKSEVPGAAASPLVSPGSSGPAKAGPKPTPNTKVEPGTKAAPPTNVTKNNGRPDPATVPPRPNNGIQPTTVAYSPLGLRYSLLRFESGEFREVDPVDTIFHSGERIQLNIESNESAYLYIVTKGSSGAWAILFPSKEINNGDNHIKAGSRYTVPPVSAFKFNDDPGMEHVFTILSRKPEEDLDSLIYSLSRTKNPTTSDGPSQILGQDIPSIPDSLITEKHQQMASRDLIFEKIDGSSPDRKEKAMYVVNAKAGADARVMVDLNLRHQ